jgi:RNA polymerase sigma-70 factor (ECF subfamily)
MFSSVPSVNESHQENGVLEAIRAGQTTRFEELVSAYQNRLFGAMLAMLGDRQDAEDITQEAFIRAYSKLETFQAKSSFFTWLHRIAFNLAIDLRRSEKRAHRIGTVTMDVATNDLVSAELSPASQCEQNETQRKIYEALSKIDPERRSVITLRDLQGMDYADIAEVLAIPVGTVRSRLHRARMELRDLLSEYVEAESIRSRSEMEGGNTK